MVRMKAVNGFASTVWGNIDAGGIFDVEDGYVRDLEAQGVAYRVDKPAAPPATVAVKGDDPLREEIKGEVGKEFSASEPDDFTRALTGQTQPVVKRGRGRPRRS